MSYLADLDNNNGVPICHTSGGKPKALSQARQVKALIQALKNIDANKNNYQKQLTKTGHTIGMIACDDDKLYLSHLTKNIQSNLANIQFSTVFDKNPLVCTNAELLDLKLPPGRKTTDFGKTTRSYTRGETQFYKKHFLNPKHTSKQENDVLNIRQFFGILRLTAQRIASKIKKEKNFPNRMQCNHAKYYRLLYDTLNMFDLKQEYLATAKSFYGNETTMRTAMQADGLKTKMEQKLQLLKELDESK